MKQQNELNDSLNTSVKQPYPDDIPLSLYLQWPFIKIGRSVKSMVNGYKKLFMLEGEDLKTMYLKKARAADLRGETTKCIKFMQVLTSKYPDDSDIFYQLGIAYEKAGQFGAARQAYIQTAEINPESVKAHYRTGIIYIREREFENAIAALNQALQLEPQSAEIQFRLGQAYDRIKDYEKAIAYFKKAVALNPNLIQAYKNMALTYDSMDDHKKALDCLKRVLELEEAGA
ncbi:magnetosome protein MamA, greigite-specific [Candidatus Magnetomorum sp. HK-1]|nr:magnetosome protein MamA, greigite-specific [Candidatus Magnetomorum sp. HK-1]